MSTLLDSVCAEEKGDEDDDDEEVIAPVKKGAVAEKPAAGVRMIMMHRSLSYSRQWHV